MLEPVIKTKVGENMARCFWERVAMASVKGNPARILNVYLVCEGGEGIPWV